MIKSTLPDSVYFPSPSENIQPPVLLSETFNYSFVLEEFSISVTKHGAASTPGGDLGARTTWALLDQKLILLIASCLCSV